MADKPAVDSEIPWEHLTEEDAGKVAKLKGYSGVLIAVLASLISLGLVVGTYWQSTSSFSELSGKFDALQEQTVALSIELGETQEERRALSVKVDLLERQQESDHQEIESLKALLAQKDLLIAQLKGRIEELERAEG